MAPPQIRNVPSVYPTHKKKSVATSCPIRRKISLQAIHSNLHPRKTKKNGS